jgi:hypothetical protein
MQEKQRKKTAPIKVKKSSIRKVSGREEDAES